MKTVILVISFILINTLAAEFMLNRASSTTLSILFGAIFIASFYFLIYKPIKKLL
jgi:hypothetical protein